MATFADRVAAAVLPIGNTTYRTNIDTAVDTFEAAVKAEVITGASRTEEAGGWLDIQDKMIDITRMIASELADTSD